MLRDPCNGFLACLFKCTWFCDCITSSVGVNVSYLRLLKLPTRSGGGWWFSHSVVSDLATPMNCCPPDSSVLGIFQARIPDSACPSPGVLPDQRLNSRSLRPSLQADSLPTGATVTFFFFLSDVRGKQLKIFFQVK